MSYFKTKMHQITALPRPLAGFKGLTSKRRKGTKDEKNGQGRERGEYRVRKGIVRDGEEGKGE